MANTKISELPALTSANLQDVDLLPIVDVDTNNDGNASDKTTKSITFAELKSGLFQTGFTVSGNILPNANETLDIGTASLRFRDIYLSGDTIDLGGTKLNKNTDGDLEVKDSSGSFKKVKAAEIELDDGTKDAANKVVFRMGSDGAPEFTKIRKSDGAAVDSTLKCTILSVAKNAEIGGSLTVTSNVIASTAPSNANHLANKQYVDSQVSSGAGASLESPTFTGTPLAPTAASGTNTTQLATTAFVTTAVGGVSGGSATLVGLTDTAITSIGDGEIIAYDNSSSKYVNKTLAEAGIAKLASPSFTGNVGIGTASPGTSLEVSGNNFNTVRIRGEETDAVLQLLTSSTATSITDGWTLRNDYSDSDKFQMRYGNSSKVTMTSGGNFGIGTTAPSKPLHVQFSGDSGVRIESSDNHASLYLDSHSSKGQYIRFTENDANKYWINSNGGNLVFRPAATGTTANQIYFNSSGNIGVGKTPSSGVELDVNGDIAASGNVTSATPTANTHLTTKDYVDSQLGGVAGNTVIVKKITGAQMSGLRTTSSTWIELIPAPGAGNFIAVREFECYIDRGGSAASGVAPWRPLVSGVVRGFGDDVQLAFRTTYGGTNDILKYNTFGLLQKGILNHLINSAFNQTYANTDIVLVRDSPVTQTRAYPNVPLLLRPRTSATTNNFITYASTATHTCNDDYYLRISYRIMSLSSHFQVT